MPKIIKYIAHKIDTDGLIQRKRKIKSSRILIIAAYYHIVCSMSYRQLAPYMALKQKKKMSDTAWKNRLSAITPYFLKYAMEYLNEHSYRRRWDIEIRFKKLESGLRFHKIRRSFLPYMLTSVRLWHATAFLILSVMVSLPPCSNFFGASEFNAFALIAFWRVNTNPRSDC